MGLTFFMILNCELCLDALLPLMGSWQRLGPLLAIVLVLAIWRELNGERSSSEE